MVLAAAGVGVWTWQGHRDETVDLLAGLPRDGLVAADVTAPQTRHGWRVTSGTLMTRQGDLWSGTADEGPPDVEEGRTGNAVLRAVTERRDFGEVRVHLEMRTLSLGSTSRTPERSWDGVHLFLRYQDPDDTYVVDLLRRDGAVKLKRKQCIERAAAPRREPCAQARYTTLAEGVLGAGTRWRTYVATIADGTGGTRISLTVDGRTVLTGVDDPAPGSRHAGRVGLRGDNAVFRVRAFEVAPVG